jgi:hypothetical protein
LTYAAGTAASTIVWITPRFRDEHRQALTWLNEHTDQDTHFFGVELEVVRIGNSAPAPLFKVVALPNDWQKSVRASTVSAGAGTRNELYRQFWAKLLERIKAEHPSWTGASGAAQNWLWITAPIRGCGLNPVFGGRGRIRQELYIDRPMPEQCRAVFDALQSRREEFEAAYGRQLEWDALEGKKACRIADTAVGKVENEAEHEKYNRVLHRCWRAVPDGDCRCKRRLALVVREKTVGQDAVATCANRSSRPQGRALPSRQMSAGRQLQLSQI